MIRDMKADTTIVNEILQTVFLVEHIEVLKYLAKAFIKGIIIHADAFNITAFIIVFFGDNYIHFVLLFVPIIF